MAETLRERLFVAESARSMDEVCAALERSIAEHKFGLLHVHDVTGTLAKKGVVFDRPVKVFDVCNPHQAKKVLDANVLISTVLPCSISVFREGDRTRLAFVRPTVMLAMFESPGLGPVAAEVEASMRSIVETAAR